jgi:capsular polysaccharide biosynthesis protein
VEDDVTGASGWLRLRYWDWKTGAIVLVGALFGTVVAILLQPDEYRSSALVSIEPRAGRVVSGTTVTLLSPRYVAFATSDFTANRTARILGLPRDQVAGRIGAGIPPESVTLRVSAQAGDAQTASRIASTVAAQVLDEAKRDSLLRARLVSPAAVPKAPARASRRGLLVSGALASVLIAGATAYLMGSRRLRRTTADAGADASDESGPPDAEEDVATHTDSGTVPETTR